jgi:hypothetical protein
MSSSTAGRSIAFFDFDVGLDPALDLASDEGLDEGFDLEAGLSALASDESDFLRWRRASSYASPRSDLICLQVRESTETRD